MSRWVDRAPILISVFTAGVLLSSINFELNFFSVVGWPFLHLFTVQDYLVGTILWLPFTIGFVLVGAALILILNRIMSIAARYISPSRKPTNEGPRFVIILLCALTVMMLIALVGMGIRYEGCDLGSQRITWALLPAAAGILLLLYLSNGIANATTALGMTFVITVFIVPVVIGSMMGCSLLEATSNHRIKLKSSPSFEISYLRALGAGLVYRRPGERPSFSIWGEIEFMTQTADIDETLPKRPVPAE